MDILGIREGHAAVEVGWGDRDRGIRGIGRGIL